MASPTKIVIVEHDSTDLELIHRELKSGGLNYIYLTAQNEREYEKALQELKPDIILSDYRLPSFDGLSAFNIKERIIPESPFIFVSGTIGEEKSVDLIKSGVTDYVLKDRLFTLTPKVNRALKELKEKREKVEAEFQIAFEQNNLNALINSTEDLMWSVDRDFNLITSNLAFNKVAEMNFGKPFKKGDNILSIGYSKEMHTRFKQLYERAFAGEAFTETEHFYSPVELWAEVSYYPIRRGDEIIGTACYSRDISDRKRSEKELIKSEARHREAQAIGHIGNWEIDLIERTCTWSDELYHIYGMKKNEAVASTKLFLSFIHPEDVNFAQEIATESYGSLENLSLYFRFIRKDGLLRYGYAERKFEFDRFNKPIRIFGIMKDVTERKKAELELQKSEAFNRGLINSLSAHIAVIDHTGNILAVNEAWKQFALENGETTLHRIGEGSNYYEACQKSIQAGDTVAAQALYGIKSVMDARNPFFYFEYACHSPNEQRWFAMRVMKFKNGSPMVVVAHENITQLRKVEKERDYTKEANEELERTKHDLKKALAKERVLNELKSRFVSMASHEFRTPLTTMMSSLSLISKYGELNDKENQLKHVGKIKTSIHYLTDILNDFLSLSKLEEGKMESHPKDINLKYYIGEIITEMRVMASEGQELRMKYSGNETAYLDNKLLKNILFNLISNAIKFSHEKGVIEVNVRKTASSIRIAVKDNGIGISTEDQEHLFERFFRGQNATHIQGTGLGLNIVAKYVEQMSGTIQFESNVNKGTTFIIQIPQK